MADACLAAIGVATTAAAVAAHYGADLLDGWLVDERDKAAVDAPELAGIAVRAMPLYMTNPGTAAGVPHTVLALPKQLPGGAPPPRPRFPRPPRPTDTLSPSAPAPPKASPRPGSSPCCRSA